MLGLTPEIADYASRYVLVDVRPRSERYCGLGFIPGSLMLQPSLDLKQGAKDLRRLTRGKQPVLVCLDGERSRAHALAMSDAVGAPLHHLIGGLRQWADIGLAVAGRWTEGGPATAHRPGAFQRALRSDLDVLLGDEPIGGEGARVVVLMHCGKILGESFDTCPPDRLHHLLDLVAVRLVDMGVGRARTGALIDRMLTVLPTPVPGLARHLRKVSPTRDLPRYGADFSKLDLP